MTNEELAKEFLVGKTIIDISYTKEMNQDMLIPTITLDNKVILYIQNDDKGNSSGTIHTNIENHMVLMPQKVFGD